MIKKRFPDDAKTLRLAARVRKQEQRERETKAKQKAKRVDQQVAEVIDRGLSGDLMRRCLKEMWLRGRSDQWPEGEAPPAELRREYRRLLRLTDQFRAKWGREWQQHPPA